MPEERPPLIQLKRVSKVYNKDQENEFQALYGIDLDINHGEFVAIMGPSGSGKTTMMNILGALDVSTSGQYLVNGEDVSKFSSNELAEFRNQDVGFVFQQFNLLPKFSVLDNVLLPTLYGRIPEREKRAVEVLKKVGLGSKLDNKPNQLSGGQVQRVAIARALIMNPSIIMADEPTGNLDSKTAKEIMKVLQALNFEGNTIIVITHEDEVADFAKRKVKLLDGRIV